MKISNSKKDLSSVGARRETHDSFAEVCIDKVLKIYYIMDQLIEEWLKSTKSKAGN